MFKTPSFEIYTMGPREVRETLGTVSVIHQEWIAAKCGFLTESEKIDFEVVPWVDEYIHLSADEIVVV